MCHFCVYGKTHTCSLADQIIVSSGDLCCITFPNSKITSINIQHILGGKNLRKSLWEISAHLKNNPENRSPYMSFPVNTLMVKVGLSEMKSTHMLEYPPARRI